MNICECQYNLSRLSISEISLKISQLAEKAMLDEVYTTPKPGLVDCYSNGAHTDMNLLTFQKSAEAISPYLAQMAEAGAYAAKLNEDTFAVIRKIGMKAEKAMYQATDGVNTHKGMIFSMGILSAVAGYCISRGYRMTESTLFFLERKLVKNTLQKELLHIKNMIADEHQTNGERLCQSAGITGVRGEAMSGYESVRHHALPQFQSGMNQKKGYNLVKLQTLFTLMKSVEDSNIAARRGTEATLMVKDTADLFLKNGGAYQENAIEQLRLMDAFFVEQNLSAGGCADLLAVTIFVYDLIEHYGELEKQRGLI